MTVEEIANDIKDFFPSGEEIWPSIIQKQYKIGYNKAGKVFELMKQRGWLQETKYSHLGYWILNATKKIESNGIKRNI